MPERPSISGQDRAAGGGAAQERCSRRTPAFDPQQTSEQRLPRLGERPHSSDGEAALNDRSGREAAVDGAFSTSVSTRCRPSTKTLPGYPITDACI